MPTSLPTLPGTQGIYTENAAYDGARRYLKLCDDGQVTQHPRVGGWCEKLHFEPDPVGSSQGARAYGIYTTDGSTRRYLSSCGDGRISSRAVAEGKKTVVFAGLRQPATVTSALWVGLASVRVRRRGPFRTGICTCQTDQLAHGRVAHAIALIQ